MPSKVLLSACLAVMALGAAPVFAAATCDDPSIYGAILSQQDIDGSVKALPPEALVRGKAKGAVPLRVTLRNLPAVAQQGTKDAPGSPGSCEAQSYGYGLGSYTAARGPGGKQKWNASLPQNSISAAYLYTLIHSQSDPPQSCPTGSRSLDYLSQLTRLGAPNRQQIPYHPHCPYLDNVDIHGNFPGMDRFRIGSYAVIPVAGNANAVPQIKSHLRAGQAVAFTGSVLCNYATPTFVNGVIYERDLTDKLHGQLLVGYDDTIGQANEKGALLVQNSFGTDWPPPGTGSAATPGRAYWSYGSFTASQRMAAVAYPRAVKPGRVKLSASLNGAPAASLAGAWQWTPAGSSPDAYLILTHVFAEPVQLATLSLTEPGGTPVKVTAIYGQPISSGYSYLKRADGKAFLTGSYGVELQAKTLGGQSVTYRGRVALGALTPGTRGRASMSGVAVTGPTGSAAQVVPPP